MEYYWYFVNMEIIYKNFCLLPFTNPPWGHAIAWLFGQDGRLPRANALCWFHPLPIRPTRNSQSPCQNLLPCRNSSPKINVKSWITTDEWERTEIIKVEFWSSIEETSNGNASSKTGAIEYRRESAPVSLGVERFCVFCPSRIIQTVT
jgi:hypothetical protein